MSENLSSELLQLHELGVESERKNIIWQGYTLKWAVTFVGSIFASYHPSPFLMVLKAYQAIGYYISLELFTILVFVFFEKLNTIQEEIM
jgi:hypothetical protein